MASDHPDSEKGNPLPPHGLLFPNNSKGEWAELKGDFTGPVKGNNCKTVAAQSFFFIQMNILYVCACVCVCPYVRVCFLF